MNKEEVEFALSKLTREDLEEVECVIYDMLQRPENKEKDCAMILIMFILVSVFIVGLFTISSLVTGVDLLQYLRN